MTTELLTPPPRRTGAVPLDPTRRRGLAAAMLVTARPRQWLKNLLVLAAPAAAGVLLVPSAAAAAAWAAVAFTLASASTYFVNDARDIASDRTHPVKSRRPVAAGELSPRAALRIGAGLAVLSLVAAAPLGPLTVAVVAGYLVLTLAYSTWLKDQSVLDVLAVASGFVLRTLAGAAAVGLTVSSWFLLVALFGSLFLVTAKRAAEQNRSGADPVRATVRAYPASWLQQVLTTALTGTVLAYATWALQYVGTDIASAVLVGSVLPFLAIMLRYSLLVARGDGESPEVVLTSDRFVLVAGALWGTMIVGAIYLA